MDPLARRIGAVNTVWKKAGKWRGTNTDAEAVTVPLARKLRLCPNPPFCWWAMAARLAARLMRWSDSGAKVSMVGRNPDRVRSLARACGAEPLLREQLNGRKFDAVVHATPLGMFPHVEACFFQDAIPAELVFDMVYNPLETTLLRRAASAGHDRDSRASDVPRAGRAPVRNLDRRDGAALRDGESRPGSARAGL